MKFISIIVLLLAMGCTILPTKEECNNIEGKHWTVTNTKSYDTPTFSFCVDDNDTRWK